MYIVVGLGNIGDEYKATRHNAGKIAVSFLQKKGLDEVKFVDINSYMNVSGPAIAKHIKEKEDISKLVVIYDDLDLPIGTLRISQNRGSGGHNGIESIEKALKSREFIRFRIGIAPVNIFGKMKKPRGDKDVQNFVLGKFKKSEREKLEEVFMKIEKAISVLCEKGLNIAMTEFNK